MEQVRFNFNFADKKVGVEEILVTNDSTRDWVQNEIVFVRGVIGEVMPADGIPGSGGQGLVRIKPDRIFSTNQVAAADTFVAGSVGLYFQPQTDAAPGVFHATSLAGRVLFPAFIEAVGPANAYIELKPPHQNGTLSAS